MKKFQYPQMCALMLGLVGLWAILAVAAQQTPDSQPRRDGQHDFDFPRPLAEPVLR
jgi:hypothetical protein